MQDLQIFKNTCNRYKCCYCSMSVEARMDQLIKDYAVLVVSKSYCPFCHMAKNVLAKYDIQPDKMKIIEIDGDPDGADIQDYLQQITGGRTVRLQLDIQ